MSDISRLSWNLICSIDREHVDQCKRGEEQSKKEIGAGRAERVFGRSEEVSLIGRAPEATTDKESIAHSTKHPSEANFDDEPDVYDILNSDNGLNVGEEDGIGTAVDGLNLY